MSILPSLPIGHQTDTTPTPINRAEELMAIEQIAKEYPSMDYCTQRSQMACVIAVTDQVEAKILTSQLKASGWPMVDLIFGRMSNTWYISVHLNTKPTEY
jgi:hypothetical protein